MSNDYYLNFDGLDKSVSIANNAVLIPGTGDFTISLWEYGGTAGTLISKRWITGGQENGYILVAGSGFLYGNCGIDVIFETAMPSATEWHHIVWSRDVDNDDVLYIDGAAIDTSATVAIELLRNYSSTASVTIGMQLDAPFHYFDGAIDDVRIYTGVALTAAQVADIYYGGAGWKVNETEFAAITSNGWYSDCDDGTGTTLTGRLLTAGTWSAHNGTLADAGLWAAGGIPLHCIELDSNFKEYTRYINRTSKAIQFRFRSKDAFAVREYKILNPHVEGNR